MLHYRQLFIKDDVLIGEWGIFSAEVFLHYSQFFIKGDFVKDGVECSLEVLQWVMLNVRCFGFRGGVPVI